MLLIIDNYDSFTYNLVQYFGEMGAVMEIRRNDQITLEEIEKLKPDHICISPGPCTPKEAGISCAVIERFGKSIPAARCVPRSSGHRACFRRRGRPRRTAHARQDLDDQSSRQSVFKDLPQPFEATRYHSLIVKRDTLPDCLEITATASDDESEIMGLRHKELPIHGVQFHPESILTQDGKQLLKNFLEM
jgi:anthranilate synthase/aminodeoxychorismate synthase-like glutamine amidotransferase